MVASHEPGSPSKKSYLPALLLICLLAGGGAYYWSTLPSAPPWLKSLLPSKDGGAPPAALSVPSAGSAVSGAPALPGAAPAGRADPSPLAEPLRPPLSQTPQAGASPSAESSPSPHEDAGNAAPLDGALEQIPGAPGGPASPGAAPGSAQAEEQAGGTPVIVYGKGKRLSPEGHVAGGNIDKNTPPVDVAGLYGTRESRAPSAKSVSPKGEDNMLGMDFINDLASFLAANYWPAGSHPLARQRGITTTSVKWANLKYGSHLEGFNVSRANPRQERERILRYVLMPSMVNGLYRLYNERFIAALNREAMAQTRDRGNGPEPLSPAELADMYRIYAVKAQGLSGAIHSYLNTPDIRKRIEEYIASENATDDANMRYMESEHSDPANKRNALAGEYQKAVIRREQARDHIAASMRRGGGTQGMDTDSLVYTAMWLYRRTPEASPALSTLASVLSQCADRLEEEKNRHQRTGQ